MAADSHSNEVELGLVSIDNDGKAYAATGTTASHDRQAQCLAHRACEERGTMMPTSFFDTAQLWLYLSLACTRPKYTRSSCVVRAKLAFRVPILTLGYGWLDGVASSARAACGESSEQPILIYPCSPSSAWPVWRNKEGLPIATIIHRSVWCFTSTGTAAITAAATLVCRLSTSLSLLSTHHHASE